jgi:mannose-1-phosphate guanylyltransferase/mannose-1-phosphate guanylyltransferase/mannose-6-phosphate isomerase
LTFNVPVLGILVNTSPRRVSPRRVAKNRKNSPILSKTSQGWYNGVMFSDCLIMAGGSGTRLWPASNSAKPKQFLPAAYGSPAKGAAETFFSLSLRRAFQVVAQDSGRVMVIAGKAHLPHVVAACSPLSAVEKKRLVLIPEPLAKNTAPAIACAIAYSRVTGGRNNNMLVLTSDHIIKPLEAFGKDAAVAARFAAQGRLVVFGIPPSRPETGYGYIKTARKLDEGVYAVAEFREKPDSPTAKKLSASPRYFWNSGMFAFNGEFLTEEFRRLAAGVTGPFERLRAPGEKSYTKTKGLRILSGWDGLDKAYRVTQNISFDYAIAAHCSRTVMVRAAFDWLDVGSWDEYARLLYGGSAGGGVTGTETYAAGDCGGCFVDSDIPVALVGVKDLVVVIRSGKDGPQAALIAQKGDTQRVRDIVEQIKQSGKTEIL